MVKTGLYSGMMKNNTNSEMMTTKTIDVTPTWEAMVPVLMYLIRNSQQAHLHAAEQELRNMAQAADRWNAHCRETR